MRLIDFFDRGVALYGDRVAFDDGDLTLTYNEANSLSHRIACALRDRGFKAGAKVGILSPNASIAFSVLLGSLRAELIWLPLNPRNPVDDTIDLLSRFDGELLIFHSVYEELVPRVLESVSGIRAAVCMDRDSEYGETLGDWIEGAADHFHETREDPDDIMGIFPTGGTTGPSKGVMMTHRQVETMFANFHAHLNLDEGDRHLVVAPMTHAAGVIGMLFFPIGGVNQIMAKADPVAIMEAIEKHRITHLFLPPTLILMMLAEPSVRDYDYSSLKHFMVGAAPISTTKLVEAVQVFGPVMTEIFGQVEAPASITIKSPGDYIRSDGSIDKVRARSAGRPTLFTRVAILDDDGEEVPQGDRGEICVKGNLVMPGYYKNPEATLKTLKNGWLHTGDIGIQDKDGFITIVDRKKDMIISGGFNVYPNEVEQVLTQYPGVQDCAVIGVPDEKWGEAVKGVVQLKPDAGIDEHELLQFCKEKLGGVKAPKSIDMIPDLPRSPNGKVLKRELRKRYWQGNESAII